MIHDSARLTQGMDIPKGSLMKINFFSAGLIYLAIICLVLIIGCKSFQTSYFGVEDEAITAPKEFHQTRLTIESGNPPTALNYFIPNRHRRRPIEPTQPHGLRKRLKALRLKGPLKVLLHSRHA
jgi:hypothetical protein